MNTTSKMPLIYGALLAATFFTATIDSCDSNNSNRTDIPARTQEQMVAQGKYLVETADCNDCHTPLKFTANGPVPDSTRYLSGVSQDAITPTTFDEKEMSMVNAGGMITFPNGAFAGAWGISFPSNLTPDSTTGLGGWTADIFIRAIRHGKYQGVMSGRDMMPLMPWQNFKNFTDEDLEAIFAFLQTIPAVHNRVPSYVPLNQLALKK